MSAQPPLGTAGGHAAGTWVQYEGAGKSTRHMCPSQLPRDLHSGAGCAPQLHVMADVHGVPTTGTVGGQGIADATPPSPRPPEPGTPAFPPVAPPDATVAPPDAALPPIPAVPPIADAEPSGECVAVSLLDEHAVITTIPANAR